ncbi:MAG TPA: hypothetical protein DDW42_10265 [Desulfobacteraceae bacterium]|nr:hypothetical protein [Desulfobacteraceae bacterium]
MALSVTIGIYKITAPSGKIYIGQSWNVHKRKLYYKAVKCAKQAHLFHSFQKYGFEKHIFEIIHCFDKHVTQEMMDFAEQYYMDHYRALGHALINIREGGSRGKHSEKTKKKLSLISKPNAGTFKVGHKHSEESKRKMSLSNIGKPGPNKGKKMGKEQKEKIRASKKGKYVGEEHWNTKDLINTKTNAIYHSIKEAAKQINMKRTTLNAMLSGQNKNTSGVIYCAFNNMGNQDY